MNWDKRYAMCLVAENIQNFHGIITEIFEINFDIAAKKFEMSWDQHYAMCLVAEKAILLTKGDRWCANDRIS